MFHSSITLFEEYQSNPGFKFVGAILRQTPIAPQSFLPQGYKLAIRIAVDGQFSLSFEFCGHHDKNMKVYHAPRCGCGYVYVHIYIYINSYCWWFQPWQVSHFLQLRINSNTHQVVSHAHPFIGVTAVASRCGWCCSTNRLSPKGLDAFYWVDPTQNRGPPVFNLCCEHLWTHQASSKCQRSMSIIVNISIINPSWSSSKPTHQTVGPPCDCACTNSGPPMPKSLPRTYKCRMPNSPILIGIQRTPPKATRGDPIGDLISPQSTLIIWGNTGDQKQVLFGVWLECQWFTETKKKMMVRCSPKPALYLHQEDVGYTLVSFKRTAQPQQHSPDPWWIPKPQAESIILGGMWCVPV